MSQSNQIILCSSFVCLVLCLITQQWIGSSSLSFYLPIVWAVVVTILSTWISCFVLKLSLRANSPITLPVVSRWLRKKIEFYLKLNLGPNERYLSCNSPRVESNKEDKSDEFNKAATFKSNSCKDSEHLGKITNEIDVKYIKTWYKSVSDDERFPEESRDLLLKLSIRLNHCIESIDKVSFVDKLAGVLLFHLKEYRRAVRRVEKGYAGNVEEAYRCSHPGSRSPLALEYTLGRLVTVIAREFLQWELGSSLPCKLLLSILSKRLLIMLETMCSPIWILNHLTQLNSTTEGQIQTTLSTIDSVTIPSALSEGMITAAAIARPLSKPDCIPLLEVKIEVNNTDSDPEKSPLSLEIPISGHRCLWGDLSALEADSEMDDDRISPVYEEPTDFASTIARLRNLLQQKSTATTPLHPEEKSYVICEESQFTNLAIPLTEFYTAPDGSQQLLYCIQFDDVEQHGVDTFETTTATVRRQYSDFAQLHASLEEIPSLSAIMADIILPEGGRVELENYLKALCASLRNEYSGQLRRFLRPSSGAGKKADVVAPRFDRFLAKTVSGVFNTLKTVVPGFEMDQEEENVPLPTLMPLADIPWRFVQDINQKNLAFDLGQFVADRTDYCSVDTAYEAVESVEGSGDSDLLAHWWEIINATCDESPNVCSRILIRNARIRLKTLP
ncbi:uncharacterized protein LOC117182207 isoform X2 [Belonocnema kinseyi]|uniref:uncharacterized protein LOC117182207 isoform X2 n=1 Tax=Belonocnema kinseyi TaxID=2817044 RepID=UPI00143D0AC5|nr:uncharacterized protein LOC117182207 isoform X2 [Belonocnema kinseyi]